MMLVSSMCLKVYFLAFMVSLNAFKDIHFTHTPLCAYVALGDTILPGFNLTLQSQALKRRNQRSRNISV